MLRNALPATEFFRIPLNRVIELGGQVEMETSAPADCS